MAEGRQSGSAQPPFIKLSQVQQASNLQRSRCLKF